MNPIIPQIEINGTWYDRPDYKFLADKVQEYQPRVAVELGGYKGMSAVTIASAMPDDGHIWCVDMWKMSRPDECQAYIDANDLTDKITLVTAKTVAAAAMWDGPPVEFLHVDADHSEWATTLDVISWLPNLADKAFLVGHDFHWESVQNAINKRVAGEGIVAKLHVTEHQWGTFSARFGGELLDVLPQQWYAEFDRSWLAKKESKG